MPNQIVDFMIIGAGKSGSTSLYYYLAQHPDIYLPRIKEPRFFLLPGLGITTTNDDFEKFLADHHGAISSMDAYESLFEKAKHGQVTGEASIAYLSSEVAARNIGTYAPSVKLLCVLRNPIERAYSNYLHFVRDKAESRSSILDVLREEGASHPYFHAGFYYKHLQTYKVLAPENPMRLWLYEDLVAQPLQTISEIFQFLKVDDTFIPNVNFRANVSGLANENNLWARFYDFARNSKLRTHPVVRRVVPISLRQFLIKLLSNKADTDRIKPELTQAEYAGLAELYESDIKQLAELVDRDLSYWLELPS